MNQPKNIHRGKDPLFACQNYYHLFILGMMCLSAVTIFSSQENLEALLEAARTGDASTVEKLIQLDINVNIADGDGTTPLINAAWEGHAEIAQMLINAGADPNKADNDNVTPLHSASLKKHPSVVQILVSAGANLDLQNGIGDTALILAARNGHKHIAQILLNANAHPDIENNAAQNALDVARESGHQEIVEILQPITWKEKIEKIRQIVNMIEKLAVKHDENFIKKILTQNKNITNNELLLIAVSLYKRNTVTYLLDLPTKERPDINYAEPNRGFTPLLTAIQVNNIPAIVLLIEAGTDLDQPSIEGFTPLILAAITNNTHLVNMLLRHGAKINAVDNFGYSALAWAVKNNALESALLLLDAGADIPSDDSNYLVHPVYISIKKKSKQALEMLLHKKPSLINMKIKTGEVTSTLLLIASHIGSPEIVQLLIQQGADPNERVGESPSALFIAVTANNQGIVEELLRAGATALSEQEQNTLQPKEKKLYQTIRKKVKQTKRKRKKRKSKLKKQAQQKPTTAAATAQLPLAMKPQPEPTPSPAAAPVMTSVQLVELQKTADTIKLWELVGEGKAKQVSQHLEKSFDANFTDQGETLLARAVKLAIQDDSQRRYLTVQVLLNNKEIEQLINDPDPRGISLIQQTITNNRPDLARLLAEHGAIVPQTDYPTAVSAPAGYEDEDEPAPEPSPAPSRPEMAQSDDPLFAELGKGSRAKVEKIEQILIQKPGGLSRQRTHGKTPLMHAIESKVTEKTLRFILGTLSEENMQLSDSSGETALTRAIKTGRISIINLLLDYRIRIRDKDIEAAREQRDTAERQGHESKGRKFHSIVKLLEQVKERQEVDGALLESTQTRTNDFGPVRRALDAGADINTQDLQGNTPLIRAIQAHDDVKAQGLIERKARLNIQNKDGETALILAASLNNYGLIDYLLKHGADETISDNTKYTAYGYAMQKGHTDIANRILTYKALKNLRKSHNVTHALQRHTILRGANPTIIGDAGQDLQNNPYTGRHTDNSVTTFFPRSWNKEKVQEAIQFILEKPEQLTEKSAQLTEDNKVLRNALILRGTYQGVPINAVISQTRDKHAPWKVFTAYPELKQ